MRKLLIVLVMALLTPALAAPSVLYCPADGNYTEFLNVMNDSGLFGDVVFYDAQNGTPTVAEMQQYAIVYTYSNQTYHNNTLFGDNIADYMDLGGTCVSAVFSHSSATWNIGGRYASDEAYAPLNFAPNTTTYTSMTDPVSHPIMDGVNSISNIRFHHQITTRAGATRLASLADSYHLAAINASENAVALNLYTSSNRHWTGDGHTLMLNAMVYLINANKPNLTEVEADGMTVFFHFDKDTNEPVINASNIDDVFALSRVIAGFGSIHAASLTPSPLSGPSWLSGDGSLGDAVWTDAQTLEVTLSASGGAPTVEIGDTVTVDGSTVQLADVNNPCDSEVAITGAFNIVSTTWGSLKTLE